MIHIDLQSRCLAVELSDAELGARRQRLRPRPPRFRRGWLARYARLVTNASNGAVLA